MLICTRRRQHVRDREAGLQGQERCRALFHEAAFIKSSTSSGSFGGLCTSWTSWAPRSPSWGSSRRSRALPRSSSSFPEGCSPTGSVGKKVIVLGTTLRIVGPVLLFFAPTWEWVIPGMIFNALSSLYMLAFNAIIADSLPHERRGAAYGAYRTAYPSPTY